MIQPASSTPHIAYRNAKVDGLNIFYREAGSSGAPTVLLLHGFPSSSHMFRNLIPSLAEKYHVVAPDYPGYGYSDTPSVDEFKYTFDHLADIVERFLEQKSIQKYSIYIQDYGSPIGFRLATRHPEHIQAIITQNGNAYEEGLSPFWDDVMYPFWKDRNPTTEAKAATLVSLESTKFQYFEGARNSENISPDAWKHDQAGLDRPGNGAIQLALAYDYRTNPPLYPVWHKFLKDHQPPVLAAWGKNDPIFPPPGAEAFRRDVPDAEIHLLDTGHFALEEDGDKIAALILDFLGRKVIA